MSEITSHSSVQVVSAYLQHLQKTIIDTMERIDGKSFTRDAWRKKPEDKLQGQGLTCIVEDGNVFERAGCGFSHVTGQSLPAPATEERKDLEGSPFEAMGVSLVFHPQNPYVPTIHFNIRMMSVCTKDGTSVYWFGGGMDLTPYYAFVEDVVHFHTVCRRSVEAFGSDKYPAFKRWADQYFFIKHRNEARGVGGIFFDDFSEGGFDNGFALIQSVGDELLNAYVPILEKRKNMPFGERERHFQLMRRGRYVEFNLIYDRGTKFGLQADGRTESILLSMPASAQWGYQFAPEPSSAEEKLYTDFLPAREWI